MSESRQRQGKCECSRSAGCVCRGRKVLPSSAITLPGLVLLLILFTALFVVGAAVAFYLTNTTFALLDTFVGADSNIIVDGDVVRVNVTVPLWTYVPSLVSIPINSGAMSVAVSTLSTGSTVNLLSAADVGERAGSPVTFMNGMQIKEDRAAPLRSKSERNTEIARKVLQDSVFQHLLLSDHKSALIDKGRKLSERIPRLDEAVINELKTYGGLREPLTGALKTKGFNGWIHYRSNRKISTSWPTAEKKETAQLASADGTMTARRAPSKSNDEPDFMNVEWENWLGGKRIVHLDLASATKGFNPLSDFRQTEPATLAGFVTEWNKTLMAHCAHEDYCQYGDKTFTGAKEIPLGARPALSLVAPRRHLESRSYRPRAVSVRVDRGKGSALSWWVSSLLGTVMESCAEEAEAAADLLKHVKVFDDIEVGHSCGERWLAQLSDPTYSKHDPGAIALGASAHLVSLDFNLNTDDFERYRDPLSRLSWLKRGLSLAGNVELVGTITDSSLATSLNADCSTWGNTNLVIEFEDVSACSWCRRIMSSHSYSHSVFVPCKKT